MDASYKKRHRIPASCSVCRKRKSKCDRTRPVCGTCKKKSIAHLCNYEDDASLPANNNTTYLPMAASPRPSIQYGQPAMNPSPHMAHPSFVPPPHGHPHGAPPPNGSHGQMLPSPGIWSATKPQYFDMPHGQISSPHNSLLAGHSQSPQLQHPQHLPQHSLQNPHQNSHPSPLHANAQNRQSFSASHQAMPGFQGNQPPSQHAQQPQQSQPVFQYYQPRDSVSSGSSSNRRGSESAPLVPMRSKSISSITGQPVLSEEKENVTLPQLLESSAYTPNPPQQLSPSSLSASSTIMTTSNSTMQPTGSNILAQPPMMTSSESSPAGTISSASSVPLPPRMSKSMGSQTSSLDDVVFRPPQKRTFEQVDEGKRLKFVTVSIGSNMLQIDADDRMESFSGASHSLMVEGSYWQQQGPISYVGLVKSDPYIKLVRSFTLELFKSEQFSQFVSAKRRRQALMNGSPASQCTMTTSVSGSEDQARSEHSEYSTHFDDGNADDGDSESEVDIETEGGLIVNTISANPKIDRHIDTLPVHFPTLRGIQSLKSIYSSKDEYYAFVKVSVLEILPRKRSVHVALQRFFRYVLPFISFLDEKTFLSEVKLVFNNAYDEDSNAFYTSLKVKNDNHLNVLGQLLLMIRLGYMSLIPNNENDVIYTSSEQELIRDITRFKSDQYISVVNLCIPEEKIQTKSTFKFVQALTLLHFYRSVAPNDCHGLSGSDSQLLFGSIVNHALSIGLNRDPMKFSDIKFISKEPAFVQSWRTLWHYICIMDSLQAMYCGTTLNIPSLDISDVETPDISFLQPENVKFFEHMQTMLESYRRITNKITNLRTKPKVIEVLQETSCLEKLFLEIFGTDFFRDYVCKPASEQIEGEEFDPRKHEDSYMKVNRFICFMHMRSNLSCLYYLIALHYENKLDEDKDAEIGAGIELFKIFIRSVIQLVYIMSYALDNSQELFGRCYDYLITSRIEKSMIKTHNFITSFFIRLVNYKRSLAVEEAKRDGKEPQNESEDFNLRCEVVDSLFTIALIESELFVGNFRVLSKTYINSYKLYVMAYFVLKQCMENPEKLFGTSGDKMEYFHEGTNMLQFLTIPELQSLCKLCEEFRVAKLESIKRQKIHSKIQADSSKKAEKPVAPFDPKDPTKANDVDALDAIIGGTVDIDSTFDVGTANREMYANANTINTYGMLQEKHMHSDFSKEVLDEQSMIGTEELLKLFELYGDLDTL